MNGTNIGSENMLELTCERLAEIALETPEEELLADGGDEIVSASARRVRTLLWTTAKTFKQRALYEALDEYQKQVEIAKSRQYELPVDATGRRALLNTLFTQYPQMTQGFTLQHRDFKSMSDADVESFLKQLQALGALPLVKDEDDKGGEKK